MSKLKELFKNKFLKNIILLTGGTAFAQVLGMLALPIITRIYPPEQYGVLAVYAGLLSLLSIGAALDYPKAIPIADNDKIAFNLITLSFISLFTFTAILIVILQFSGEAVLGLFNSDTLVDFKLLIPLGVLFLGTYNIFLHWSLRVKDFKTITKTKITQSIISNFSKIFLGLISFGTVGLIIGHLIGQSGGIGRLSSPLFFRKKEFKNSIKINVLREVAKRYIKFPLYSAPSNYIYVAGNQAPVIILSAIYGATVVGYYGLASTIVNLPISFLAMSVSQVFYAEVANIGKSNPGRIKQLSLKISGKLLIIGLLPLIIFLLLGPWLFHFVFGSDWYDSGVYARVLAFLAFAHFVVVPIGRVLGVLEKQNIGLIINSIRLIVIILAFIISSLLDFTPILTVTIYVVVSSLSYFALFAVVLVVLSKEEKKLATV